MLRAPMLALLTTCLLATATDFPLTIDDVEIDGLWRARPEVVLRELPWATGDSVSIDAWELGVARLWNMDLFSDVQARVEMRDDRTVAVFDLEERFTINPLFRFSAAGDAFWVRAGLSDTNFLGRFLELGAQYERFGPYNGGQGWIRDPRFLNRRIDGLFQLERLARPRPGFVVFRALARLEARGTVDSDDRVNVLGRLDVIADRYDRIDDSSDALPPPSEGFIATAGAKVGRVDTVGIRQRGWSLELQPSFGLTNDAPSVFGQLFAEALAFASPGTRWTLAARLQAAGTTDAPRQHLLYVGGLDQVRGLEDNHIRTRAYAVLNLEARFIAFQWASWVALVPTVFVDGVVARGETTGVRALATTGGGLRVLIPRLVQSGLRADLAVTLDGSWQVQPSIGVFQFF